MHIKTKSNLSKLLRKINIGLHIAILYSNTYSW